jgi:uncharacterized RDD family membrane protein YckC
MPENGSGSPPPFPDSAEPASTDWPSGTSPGDEATVEKPEPEPPAPPAALIVQPVQPTTPPAVRYAGFWRRFWALWIDALLLVAIGLPTSVLMRAVAGAPLMPHWKESSGPPDLDTCLTNLLTGIVAWIYAASFESSEKQATLGKMALGIRVTDLDGRRISFARATGRHFAQIFDVLTFGVGYAMAGFTAKRQALHDMIAGTLVVRK